MAYSAELERRCRAAREVLACHCRRRSRCCSERLLRRGVLLHKGPHAIHIVVSGGRIQLVGTVTGAQDRQIAEVQVRSLSGALGVVNRVVVRQQ